MASKKTSTARASRTGSFTVRLPKAASTGKFVAESSKPGRIVIRESPSKSK